MAQYYKLIASAAEEYIKIVGDFSAIKLPVLKSELQYLTRSVMECELSEEGGLELPDIVYTDGMHFFSDKLKAFLDLQYIDNIFYKKAIISCKNLNIKETYWLAVVPRIDCVDLDKTEIAFEWDISDGLLPQFEVDNISILEEAVGNYKLFKIAGVIDNDIYVTEELKMLLEDRLEGVFLIPCKN